MALPSNGPAEQAAVQQPSAQSGQKCLSTLLAAQTPSRHADHLSLWDPPWSSRSTAGATSECTRQRCSSSISMQAVNVGADPRSRTVFWAPRLRASSSPRVTLQVCRRVGECCVVSGSCWLLHSG